MDAAGHPVHLRLSQTGPTLLFVFASFDGMSQASLTVVRQLAQHHPDVPIVGILHEPSAERLLSVWAAAADPPFETFWEQSGVLHEGTSFFQPVSAVPTFILLDPSRLERDRREGFLSLDELAEFVGLP